MVNIFYHIKCMWWRLGCRKCKVGSRCGCNFISTNKDGVRWRMTKGLWSILGHRELSQYLMGVWAPSSPQSLYQQDCNSSSHSLILWNPKPAYFLPPHGNILYFLLCIWRLIFNYLHCNALLFGISPLHYINNSLQHWIMQKSYDSYRYISAKYALRFGYEDINSRNSFLKTQ